MLKTGKLDNDLLEQIVFKKITFRRPEVLTRPGIGEDCAVVDFGAFVDLGDGVEGLVHISELSDKRVKSVSDVLSEGEEVLVKVISIDGNKIRLSRKAVLRDQRAKAGAASHEPHETK